MSEPTDERRLAVVTGGCNAFGLVAKAALDPNYDVILTTRSSERATRFAAEEGVATRVVDLSDFDDIRSFFASLPRCDALVNAAVARFPNRDNETYSWTEWEQELRVNVGAAYKCSVEAARHMRTRGYGRIVNVGSVYGQVAVQHDIYPEGMGHTHIVYSVSKAALAHLTRELASMWATDGITVNTVSFGGIAAGQPEAFVDNYNRKVPMGRMGRYAELVPSLRLAASPDNAYMTGQELMVDGGLTAW